MTGAVRAGVRAVAAVTAVVALAAAGSPATVAAQTVVLRGEVLDRQGDPATDVGLVVVGHPPEVVVRDGGMFAHPLSGAPSEVTVRVVGRPGIEVLFPPGGRVPVPKDPAAVVSVVVGETIDEAVRTRIEADLRALRETLERRGVADAQIEAVLSSELEGLVARIEELTRGAVETAVAGAEQVELRERVNRHLNEYLLAAADLAWHFEQIDPAHEMGAPLFQRLYRSMERYSAAYEAVRSELGAVPAALERAWPGDTGREARDSLAALLAATETQFHDPVLELRAPLDVIQRQYLAQSRRPGGDELREARRMLAEAGPRLSAVMPGFDAAAERLLASLADPGSSRSHP